MEHLPHKTDKDKGLVYILSNSRSLYTTRRLFEECVRRGHKTRVYPPAGLTLFIERNGSEVYYQKQRLVMPDIIIPRVGQKKPTYTMAVTKQFEMMGLVTLNQTESIATARDKLRSLQVLAQNNIPVPKTFFIDDISDINIAIEAIGGTPAIIKLTEGTQGMGVILAESVRSARSILESLINQGQHVLIQEFIGESSGKDIRAIVLENQVIAAMERVSIGDEFRSNIHRGAKPNNIQLSIEGEKLAKMAAKVLGLSLAGVDLIESRRGPLILEVNPSPGFEGIEAATGVNIAEKVVIHLEKSLNAKKNRKILQKKRIIVK